MAGMQRPYKRLRIDDLERLFERSCDGADWQCVEAISAELRHRSTDRAQHLASRVEQVLKGKPTSQPPLFPTPQLPLDNLSPGAKTAPTQPPQDGGNHLPPPDDSGRPNVFSRMEPPGTRGPVDAYRPQPKTDLVLDISDDAAPIDRYLAALRALVDEMERKGSSRKRYELTNGQRSEATSTPNLYVFVFTETTELLENAQVIVEIGPRRTNGTIAGIEGGKIFLALDEDLGEKVSHATLIVDDTALLKALIVCLDEAREGKIQLNHEIAKSVVGAAPLPSPPQVVWAASEKDTTDLNDAQRQVVERVSRNTVLYVWGPPGTGKTHTLARVVDMAFKENARILVCSNTNRAVDQVLLKICKGLDYSHPAMQEGRIVRLGPVSDDELRKNFSDFVTVEGIFKRRSTDLHRRKKEIEGQLAQLAARFQHARDVVAVFEVLDASSADLSRLQDRLSNLEHDGITARSSHELAVKKIETLEGELSRRRSSWFVLFKRSEEAINGDIEIERRKVATANKNIRSIADRHRTASKERSEAQERYDRIYQSARDMDRQSAIRQIEEYEKLRKPLTDELQTIDATISELKEAILRDARILGATCTKTYLSAKKQGRFDLVIIDEASMVLLPALYIAAGLSTGRVLVCGDFRQLPPIVQSEEKAILDILGDDVFYINGLTRAPFEDDRMVALKEQRRMSRPICELISEPMYDDKLITVDGDAGGVRIPLPPPYDRELTVIDTSELWPFESLNRLGSRYNVLHALLVRNLVWFLDKKGLLQEGGEPKLERLGVCTPYAAQARLIEKIIAGEGLADRVQTGTVHRFQGSERDMMVLEIPEGYGGQPFAGILVQGVPTEDQGARVINVAVSRAKSHLVIIANLTYLNSKLPRRSLLRRVLYEAQEHGRVVPGNDLMAVRPIDGDLRSLLDVPGIKIEIPPSGLFNAQTFGIAFRQDLKSAEKSIVIFSAFFTPERVGTYADLFRAKIQQGVHIRCITRPPAANGSMDTDTSRVTLDALEGLGVGVDLRKSIHQKVLIVDGRVVWFGSLNALSHTYRTDEIMTRYENTEAAQVLASFLSRRVDSTHNISAQGFAQVENPRCPACKSRTVRGEGRYGPYFECEGRVDKRCDWRESERIARLHEKHDARQDHQKPGPNCPRCGNATQLRSGPRGSFYGCVKYPICRGSVSIRTGR